MRRFLSLFTMFMLCGVLAFAQTRVVSGRVTDKEGNAVPYASVKVKGTDKGINADAAGVYSIKVKEGDVLVISATNFKAIEVTVGSQSSIATNLEKTGTLGEVVVTTTSAVGIKRNARSNASNVQSITSDQLNTIRQSDVNNALAGKVAGAQVRSQSAAALGRETVVRLRGENGIGIGGGALYVVDGTIVPSSNDINTDDVEDLTVLQGPAAAALFGPAGSNGAIVINTKKAKKGSKTLGIEINSTINFDKVYILPDYQNSYAGGNGLYNSSDGITGMKKFVWQSNMPIGWKALNGKYYPDYEEDESWGPRMVGQEYIPWYAWYPGTEYSYKTAKLTPQPNNARDFFNTGVTKLNNVNFSKAGDNYSFRASYTNLDQTGLIPLSYLKKSTFTVNGSIDLSPKLTLATNITYINQKSNAENDDGYANTTTGSFNQWFHRDIDMSILKAFSNYKTPDGVLATWNHGDPERWNPATPNTFYGSRYWFSPYAWQNNISNFVNRDRLFGDVSLNYRVNNDLSFKFTYRKQQLTTSSEVKQYNNLQNSIIDNAAGFNYWESIASRPAPWGGYGISYSYSNRQNFEFLSSYTKKINKDFSLNANAGVDILKTEARAFNANTMGGLLIPDVFTLSNSKNTINYANTISRSADRALFVRGDVSFRKYLYAEASLRKDFSSTENYGFIITTKSAGLSFVFSDLVKNDFPFLSYGKLRASTGQISNTLGIYQNSSVYSVNAQQWNGNFLMTEVDKVIDPKLHGAVNNEKEAGIELRFLKNRIGISGTYWDRTNKDFPFNVSIYGGSGYSSLATNAGEVKKTGVDVQAFFVPIRTKNLDWMLTATWGRLLTNEVVSIAPGITRIVTESGQAGTSAYLVSEVGQPWGQIRGIGFKRINGQPVIGADGLYEAAPEVNFGSSLPDFTGGVQNSFTIFKNFLVNINIDYSVGGKFFSLSEFYGYSTGLYAATAGLNDKGNPIRDKVADGGGVHVTGVNELGEPVSKYVEARDYYRQFPNGAGIAEPYIRDLTFVKLRELSVGYKIPVKDLRIGKYINSATFSIVARNPWLIYRKSSSFDPSEMSTNTGEDGQLPGTRGIGVNLKLGF